MAEPVPDLTAPLDDAFLAECDQLFDEAHQYRVANIHHIAGRLADANERLVAGYREVLVERDAAERRLEAARREIDRLGAIVLADLPAAKAALRDMTAERDLLRMAVRWLMDQYDDEPIDLGEGDTVVPREDVITRMIEDDSLPYDESLGDRPWPVVAAVLDALEQR